MLVTVPFPVLFTVSVYVFKVNVAATVFAAVIVTVQAVPLVVSQPVQLVKLESAAGAAVRVTKVLMSYDCEQSVPQLMPAGLLVTVPFPVLFTVRGKVFKVNAAVTVFAASIVTAQEVPFVLLQPVHDVKSESAAAVAVKVTEVLTS